MTPPTTTELSIQIIDALMIASTQAPELISAANSVKSLLSSNTDPTDAEEAAIRAALDSANARLQAG